MRRRASAVLSWLLVAAVVAVVAWQRSVVDPAWAGLAVLVALLAVLPALVHRSWYRTSSAILAAGVVLLPLASWSGSHS